MSSPIILMSPITWKLEIHFLCGTISYVQFWICVFQRELLPFAATSINAESPSESVSFVFAPLAIRSCTIRLFPINERNNVQFFSADFYFWPSKNVVLKPLSAACIIDPSGIFAPLSVSRSTPTSITNILMEQRRSGQYWGRWKYSITHPNELPLSMATSNGVKPCLLTTLRSAPFLISSHVTVARLADWTAKCSATSPVASAAKKKRF